MTWILFNFETIKMLSTKKQASKNSVKSKTLSWPLIMFSKTTWQLGVDS